MHQGTRGQHRLQRIYKTGLSCRSPNKKMTTSLIKRDGADEQNNLHNIKYIDQPV